jgi:hypothetical protein
VEDELAARQSGVDLLLQAAEADIGLLEFGDRVDQVAQRATKPVELLDDQGVAWSQLVEDLAQLGSLHRGLRSPCGRRSDRNPQP